MECDNRIRVAGTVNDSITDGPGFRFCLFVQGCSHHCEGCHNKQTWSKDGGTMMTADEIFTMISRNPLLSGVTFSGGEPFEQSAQLVPLARMIKNANLELCAYSGYTFEQLTAMNDDSVCELLSYCDVLVDGQFVLAERDLELKFRGSKNQRVLNVKKSLEKEIGVLETDKRWTCEDDVIIL